MTLSEKQTWRLSELHGIARTPPLSVVQRIPFVQGEDSLCMCWSGSALYTGPPGRHNLPGVHRTFHSISRVTVAVCYKRQYVHLCPEHTEMQSEAQASQS